MQLADIYITYTIVKRLSTPFDKTPAFKLGIIDNKGNVLKPFAKLKTSEERNAWTYLDIVINNIKRLLSKIPGGSSSLFVYGAALFLMREPLAKINEASSWSDSQLAESMFGSTSGDYLSEAQELFEDAPGNSAGAGNIAGIGVGPQGEPGGRAKGKFAGHVVYHVDPDTFHKSRMGKPKKARYKSLVGEDDTGKDIRAYGRKNAGKGIIISDPRTGAMTFLRRPGKYAA